MSGNDIPEVALLGDSIACLLRALARFDVPEMPAFTLIGGLAVLARLGHTHRATTDLDTATAGAERDQMIEILSSTGPGVTPGRQGEQNRLYIDGVKVDVIATVPVHDEDLTSFSASDALFLVSHRWAVESTKKLHIHGDGGVSAVVPVAVPAALVAMKLHAIEDRKAARPEKVGSDATNLFHLLDAFDESGEVAEAVAAGALPLARLVSDAAQRVLVDGALRLARTLAQQATPQRPYGEDDFRFVGSRLVEALAEVG